MIRLPHLFRRCVLLVLITTATACGQGGCTWFKSSSAPASTPAPAVGSTSSGSGGSGSGGTGGLSGASTPVKLHITYTGTSPNCSGTIKSTETKVFVPHGKHIQWDLDGTGCSGFNPGIACVQFMDDVIGTNHQPCGVGNPTNAMINAVVTSALSAPYGDGSMHTYDITYNTVPTGDPEIDINDGGGGVPGSGTPPTN